MYIHKHICISPQQTTGVVELENIIPSKNGMFAALEPALEGVPPGMLRRMSKAVRMGMGAGLPLIKDADIEGIIIGTANGGMEDCIKFLNQIVDYDEGMLTPGNFVQSTPNAIAGQLSLITKNHSYNTTHVHKGLAFENALIDAQMFINENPESAYLVGGVDEISTYNYNIDYLAGWYDKTLTNETLYRANKPATIAGEGAAMFLVSGMATDAVAQLKAVELFQTEDTGIVKNRFEHFLKASAAELSNAIFISGENGDSRHRPFFETCEDVLGSTIPVVRYKHITGEYPTASSFAMWLGGYALQQQHLPGHFYKSGYLASHIDTVVLYNQYQGKQHSFAVISK